MSYKNWTEEEDNLLKVSLTGGTSYKTIAENNFPDRTADSLRIRATRYLGLNNTEYIGKSNLKHSHDNSFWEIPNMLNCYWAGFCAADGSIRNVKTQCLFSLMLSRIDKYHIQNFIKDVKYTGDVKEYKETSYVSMTCGKQWFNDLKTNFNIVPNKTKILQPPNLPEDLSWAYFIGYLDGDGCIHVNKNGKIGISFTSSSKDILDWVKLKTESFKGIKNQDRKVKHYVNFYRFSIEGEAAAKLYIYLSEINVPKLDRKWNNDKIWLSIKQNYSHLI